MPILLFPAFARAWMMPPLSSSAPTRTMPKRNFDVFMTSLPDDQEDGTYKPTYGDSFIGGDPCGSKYNTDPHDAKVEKPGMPDSMKARIQFLVDQKTKKEEEETAKQRQEEAQE